MKNNGLVSLLIVLAFFLGRFMGVAGLGPKNGWLETLMFFGLWLLASATLDSIYSVATKKTKEEQAEIPELRAE